MEHFTLNARRGAFAATSRTQPHDGEPVAPPQGARTVAGDPTDFHQRFVALFNANFPKLFRFADRRSGEPELAADLTQEAFIRLYRRGAMPDAPEAWLISVILNLFRNSRSMESTRHRLLTLERAERVHSDPSAPADSAVQSTETRMRVRKALDDMPERDRQLLLLHAEGYSYRDIAAALTLNEASVGTLLVRARRAFRLTYGGSDDAA